MSLIALCALAAFAAAFGQRATAQAWPPVTPATASSVAVVELFTSEGCSSCPPADGVLARIVEQSRRENRRVYALSFHVDYWNDLGWPDPFSAPAYTQRQNDYARTLGTAPRIYTPQMIVNGRSEFVGSDSARADRAIAEALSAPSSVEVALRVEREGNTVRVRYQSNAPAGARVNVALIERDAERRPTRGENAGRALRHVHVVRALRVAHEASGELRIEAPAGLSAAASEVIVWVQEGATGAVLGAASAP